jgi:hypothetical protein
MDLAADPRYVGGKIGILGVLHTWTRAMVYHPHLHCLVPAGGLSADGQSWFPARKNFLVPVRALSEIFRAKLMKLLRQALPQETYPQSLWTTNWVVYCKPSLQGTPRLLDYLGRYVHRIAITNNRILSLDHPFVTFRYKDAREHRWKTMQLPAPEFIRRFLQHVLPQGFHKVRYFGLFSPANRDLLNQTIERLATQQTDVETDKVEMDGSENGIRYQEGNTSLCPECLTGHMVVIEWLPRRGRAPPGWLPPFHSAATP